MSKKQIYSMSNEINLKIVKNLIIAIENKKITIDKVIKEIIAEDDSFDGYDTSQRIMTIYYKVK